MSRQDQIVDDDEPETCPLCIEELDLSDRHFWPCPCGYQICQFCYNHLKTQLNDQCPACRRHYDDKTVKWEAPSAEELAKHKESKAQQDKKKAAARRQEAATRHADNLSRKHLSGIRVRRHNLVYVTGLRLNTSDPQLSEKLRGDQFFGQYGKIDKIVVNKPKDSRSIQPVGVYITYFDKESAALCIDMVNGSQNAGSQIRADYGTTKYCSAFLRNEICSNKNCTFLHEVGDDNESFTREGLSSLNAISSQTHAPASSSTTPQTSAQPQPSSASHQPSQPSVPAPAPQSGEPQEHGLDPSSPVESSDGSALPSTASWAKEPTSRRASQVQSANSDSPAVSNSAPMPAVTESPGQEQPRDQHPPSVVESPVSEQNQLSTSQSSDPPMDPDVLGLTEALAKEGPLFNFDDSSVTPQELEWIKNMPLLFDPYGGLRRLAARRREADRARHEKDVQVASQALSAMDPDDNPVSGSLQLGGEPDDRQLLEGHRQQQRAIRPPGRDALRSPQSALDHVLSPNSSHPPSLGTRSPMPQQQQQQQQQQQFLLQQFKSASPNPLGPSQRQGDQLQSSSAVAHSRQASRFSFANDSSSATTSIKPVTNSKLMNQQSSMMPPAHTLNQINSSAQQHNPASQFFSSGVQGPPPGLKATGTPPVSGGGMFGQGHGFATAGLGYNMNSTNRNTNDEMMRELMRARGGSTSSGQTPEGGRREYNFPFSSSHASHHNSSSTSHPGLSSFPYGSHPGALQDHGPHQKQKKKGKKHRHANTSSSGGGVVDLADPSILQARMHQTGNMGQGQYGAQGQGQDFNIFAPSGPNVLRANQQQPRAGAPSLPPGLITQDQPLTRPPVEQLFGMGPPHHQAEMAPMPGLGVLRSKQSPASTATANVPPNQDKNPRVPQLQTTKPLPTSESVLSPKILDESFPALPKPSTAKTMSDVKSKAVKQSSEDVTRSKRNAPSAKNEVSPVNEQHDFATSPGQDQKQSQEQSSSVLTDKVVTSQSSDSVPAIATGTTDAKPTTPALPAQDGSSAPSTNSRPTTPSQVSEVGARRTTQPRTIRVLSEKAVPASSSPQQASRSATPSVQSTAASQYASEGTSDTPTKGRSRRPSIASVHRSGTPASEKVTDNMSVTSGSISRASTPPLSARPEASATGKSKSKTQLKKERSERPRVSVEDKKDPLSADAVIHEPIAGRKKKRSKKSTPAAPSTPPQPPVEESAPVASEPRPVEATEQPEASQPDVVPEAIVEKAEERPAAELKPPAAERPLPSKIIPQLVPDDEIDPGQVNFFKGPASLSNIRYDISGIDTVSLRKYPTPLNTDELAQLDAGNPVRRGNDDGNDTTRLLITPGRKCLFGLTNDMEDRYLELEERLGKIPPGQRYVHKRSEGTQNLTPADDMLKDLYSSLTRPPTTIEAIKANVQTRPTKGSHSEAAMALGAASDAALTSYGEDALQYMNKFILPPLPDRGGVLANPTLWDATSTNGQYALSTANDGLYSITGAEELHLPVKSRPHIYDRIRAAGSNVDAIKQAWFETVEELDNHLGHPYDVDASVGRASGDGSGDPRIELDAMEKAIQALKKENEALDKKMLALMKRNRKFAEQRPVAEIHS